MVNRGGVERMINSGYLKRYFSDSELETIAENHYNEDEQIKIFKNVLMRNDFPDVFFDGTYKRAITTLIENIESNYPGIIQRKQQEKLGIMIKKPRHKVKKEKRKPRLGMERKTQKAASGKIYTRIIHRGSGYRWDKNQLRMLQINKEKVNMGLISRNDAIKEVVTITGRSKKATEAKYYRIKVP